MADIAITDSQTTGAKWGPIHLAPGISKRNMSMYVLGFVFVMLFSTFVPQAQPFILTEILRIPAEEQGRLSGMLGMAQTIVGLIMPSIWGTLSDKTGRRLVYAIGFLLAASGIVLYPLASSVVVLFFFRMIFAAGSNASNTMSNTLLADYIDNRDRGMAFGITSFAGGIGALLTVFLFLRLPSIFQNTGASAINAGRYTFWIVAALGVLAAILMLTGLLGKTRQQAEEKRSSLQIARIALQAAASNPGISLAYGVNFVASGAISVVGTFFTLWIVTYGVTQAGRSSAEALAQAGMIIGISQIMGLVASPIFGVLSDKIGRIRAVTLATGLTAVVFMATLLIANPLSGVMIALGLCIGFVQISGVITGGALIAQYAPEAVRGSVMGFYGFCGALGIMLAFLLGGWLFDNWTYQGPFVLAAVLSGVVCAWGLAVDRQMRRKAV
jgi:MFS family permease